MIGRRPLLAGMVVGAGVVLAVGAGAPRPEVELGARRLAEERAAVADERLAELASALAPAIDAGRAGSARVVAGDAAPGAKLVEAAEAVDAAQPLAAEAREGVDALEQARRARDPAAAPLTGFVERGELASIAQQLRATAVAADEFATRRASAAETVAALEEALAALDSGDLTAAEEAVEAARAAHAAVAEWEIELPTLPVWIETTDEMIGAVERIVIATERGDAAAAEAAAAQFAALEADGVTADRALRIAIGEGGAAVAAVPLERLAAVMASIDSLRGSLGEIAATAGA